MNYSTVIRIISLLYFGVIVEGCLRQAVNTSDEPDANAALFRTKLKECYKNGYTSGVPNLDATIDYFIFHSRWLTATTTTCSADKSSDCYKEQLKYIIPSYTVLYSVLSGCFTSIEEDIGTDARVRREITMESKVRSRRTPPDNSKMIGCTGLTTADFKTKVDDLALDSSSFVVGDGTLSGIQDIAEAFIEYIRCPACTCEKLLTTSYNINDATGCKHCWYTRLATATAETSPLRAGLVTIALRHLQSSNIVCVPSAIITVNEDEITEMEVGLDNVATQIYLGKHPVCSDGDSIPAEDADCFATPETGYEDKKLGKFILNGAKRPKCQRETAVADGKLTFTYVVTKVPTIDTAKPVTRYTCGSKKFVCELPISEVVDITPNPIVPTITHVSTATTTGTGNYGLNFALTGGDTNVEVNTDISAEITLKSMTDANKATYKLVAGKCWATPTDSSDYDAATLKYDIIDCFGCKADDDDTAVTVTTNRDNQKVEFSFKSFTWTTLATASQFIYIHCQVRVFEDTLATDHGYTPVDCSSKPVSCPTTRFRRGINMADKHLISFGPITPFHKRQGQVLYKK